MASDNRPPEVTPKIRYTPDDWTAKAWVYLIWFVIGHRVYCKIGHSKNPASRLSTIKEGFPEKPYSMQLIPCLSIQQAKLFEGILHDYLEPFKSESEWFTDSNARKLNHRVSAAVAVIRSIFQSFGYRSNFVRIDLEGCKPVLLPDGSVSHVICASE